MWSRISDWSVRKKVFLFIVVGLIVLAAIGQLTGWWSSPEPAVVS